MHFFLFYGTGSTVFSLKTEKGYIIYHIFALTVIKRLKRVLILKNSNKQWSKTLPTIGSALVGIIQLL